MKKRKGNNVTAVSPTKRQKLLGAESAAMWEAQHNGVIESATRAFQELLMYEESFDAAVRFTHSVYGTFRRDVVGAPTALRTLITRSTQHRRESSVKYLGELYSIIMDAGCRSQLNLPLEGEYLFMLALNSGSDQIINLLLAEPGLQIDQCFDEDNHSPLSFALHHCKRLPIITQIMKRMSIPPDGNAQYGLSESTLLM